MMPHELVFTVMCFICALLQVAGMVGWPKQYRLHRQCIALVNRLARLLLPLSGLLLVTPVKGWQQMHLLFGVVGHLPPTQSSMPPGLASCAAGLDCLRATSAPINGVVDFFLGASPPAASSPDPVALWKAVLMVPAINMMHANWLVPFWWAVAIQVVTFVSSVATILPSTCATLYFQWPASATILPACQQLNWLVYAAGQLLDWQVPVDPGQASTVSDAVCADPVVALVLLQVWVRLVLLVLVPCSLVYCLERSLKVGFLNTRYAGSNTVASIASVPAPAAAAPVRRQAGLLDPLQEPSQVAPSQRVRSGPSSSSAYREDDSQPGPAHANGAQAQMLGQRQQHQQRLDQVLSAVRPACVSELLAPGPGCGPVRLLLGTGFALSAVLGCWLLCEVMMVVMLKGGWRFVCSADGWLRLQ